MAAHRSVARRLCGVLTQRMEYPSLVSSNSSWLESLRYTVPSTSFGARLTTLGEALFSIPVGFQPPKQWGAAGSSHLHRPVHPNAETAIRRWHGAVEVLPFC